MTPLTRERAVGHRRKEGPFDLLLLKPLRRGASGQILCFLSFFFLYFFFSEPRDLLGGKETAID